MKRLRSLLLLLFLLTASIASAQDLMLKNARIVDPATRTIMKGALVIHDGVIRQVLKTAPATFKGQVIDMEGQWVIPGLHDMHVHSWGNLGPGGEVAMLGTPEVARLMLYCGVTGFLDLFSPEAMIFELRDQQRSAGLIGADIFAAGPILTCTGGHGTEYGLPTRVINSPADAEREISDLATKHPDVIKIVYDHAASTLPTIDHATMVAAIKAANARGLKTVIHIGTWDDAEEAIKAGATCITHIHPDPDIPDSLVMLIRQRNVFMIPTVTVQTDLSRLAGNPTLLNDPLLESVTNAPIINSYRDTSTFNDRTRKWMSWQAYSSESIYRSVKKLKEAGVKIVAGTDAGNIGTFQGYSLHRELQLLVDAGLTPWEALASATTIAGEFMGRNWGIGVGAEANLVVLSGSPIDDISNTRNIISVIHHGRLIERDQLINPTARAWKVALLDDFSSPTFTTPSDLVWNQDTDEMMQGSSTLKSEYGDGTLRIFGKMQPPPGRPGLIGISLQLDDHETPFDVTAFKGVRLRIMPTKGTLFLKLITTGIKNYDYHTVIIQNSNDFQTIEYPFTSFRQFWSAPVPWTGADMRGVALWISGMSSEDFDVVIDSIEFY